MRQGCLFVLSAPSGAGKTTILKPILEELPAIIFSVSHTTRKPRPGEQDGKDYYFVDKGQFDQIKQEDGFLEWAEVHTNYYGTSKEMVIKNLEQGIDIILDIDVQGARQLRSSKELNAHYIFIAPPSLAELEKRLTNRKTESPESLRTRLDSARHEMSQASIYDYVIINDVLDEAILSLKSVIIEKRLAGRRGVNGNPFFLP